MKTFISYTHQDEKWFKKLKRHLARLEKTNSISVWSDHKINVGEEIDREIKKELASAELFLPIISSGYLASDYCMDTEFEYALERLNEKNLKIVPILAEPCDWKSIPELKKLKICPKDAKPISKWADENEAFLDVIQNIRRITPNSKEKSNGVSTVKSVAQDAKMANTESHNQEFKKTEPISSNSKESEIHPKYKKRSVNRTKLVDIEGTKFVQPKLSDKNSIKEISINNDYCPICKVSEKTDLESIPQNRRALRSGEANAIDFPKGIEIIHEFQCKVCGNYFVEPICFLSQFLGKMRSLSEKQRAAFSHKIKQMNINQTTVFISNKNFQQFENAKLPNINQQLENLFRFIGDKFDENRKPISQLPDDIHIIIGAVNHWTVIDLAKELKNEGYIEFKKGHTCLLAEVSHIWLTIYGQKMYEQIETE